MTNNKLSLSFSMKNINSGTKTIYTSTTAIFINEAKENETNTPLLLSKRS
jgi:hypothetical protein